MGNTLPITILYPPWSNCGKTLTEPPSPYLPTSFSFKQMQHLFWFYLTTMSPLKRRTLLKPQLRPMFFLF